MANDFDDVRGVVRSLAEEFDLVDVAAAAVKAAHLATAGDGDETEIAGPPDTGRYERSGPERGPRRNERGAGKRDDYREAVGNVVKLWIGAGRQAGIRPADLVGAIAGEAGVPSKAIGAIEIAERFSLVEVPEDLADGIIAALKKATLRSQKVIVRRDRDA